MITLTKKLIIDNGEYGKVNMQAHNIAAKITIGAPIVEEKLKKVLSLSIEKGHIPSKLR